MTRRTPPNLPAVVVPAPAGPPATFPSPMDVAGQPGPFTVPPVAVDGSGTSSSAPAVTSPGATAGAEQAPAGAVTGGRPSRAPAGIQDARTWTIELPAGLPLLSQNSRLHYYERNRRVQALKKAAWALALQAKLPRLERARIVVEYQPLDSRDTDPDNVPPASGKPCIDGLVAARVLPDDSSRYVTDVQGRIGPRFPKGRIVLHVTEVADETAEVA